MKRLMILIDYVVQFAARGFIIGAIFSGLMFAALMFGFAAAAGQPQSLQVWLIVPGGTLFGTTLGAFVGFIDGLLVGVIASAHLKTCKALSSTVASLATLISLMLTFYIIASPSLMFNPITIFLAIPALVPILIVTAVTGWDIAYEHERLNKRRAAV